MKPERVERLDQRGLEPADDVGGPTSTKIHDDVSDELSGPVVGRVPASIDGDHRQPTRV